MRHYFTTIIVFSLCVLSAFSQTDTFKTYRHSVLNFKIDYPVDWNVISVDEYYNQLNTIKLSEKEFNDLLVKNASVPFFAITKYPEPFDDLNPSIKINTKPYGGLKGQSLESILRILIEQFTKMFQDFSVDQEPQQIDLGNQKAEYLRIKYTLKTQDGKSFATCSELYLIDKGEYFYMIGAGTRQDEKTGTRDEIRKILNTVEIK
jgi:hypothetical protein